MEKKMKLEVFFLLILLAFSFFIYTIYVDVPSFYPDEALRLQLSEAALIDDINPWSWRFNPDPPLSFYIYMFFITLFGSNEFSIRFATLLFGMLLVLLTYLLTKKLYNTRTAALAAIFISILPITVLYSRYAFTDIIMLSLAMMSILFLELSFKKERFAILAGIFAALSFMTKYNSIILLFIYNLYIFLEYFVFSFSIRQHSKNKKILLFDTVKLKKYFRIMSLQAVPFLMVLAILINKYFIAFGRHMIFWLIAQTVGDISVPIHYYVESLYYGLSPSVFLLLIFSIFYIFQKRKNRSDNLMIFLSIFLFLVISIQLRKFPRYVLIVVPFLVMAISHVLIDFYDSLSKVARKFLILVITFFVVLTGFSTYQEVMKYQDFTMWEEASDFINKNSPENATIFTDFQYPDNYYIKRDVVVLEGNISISEKILNMTIPRATAGFINPYIEKKSYPLKNGDMIHISVYKMDEMPRPNSPLQYGAMYNEMFWHAGKDENKIAFTKYVEENYDLVYVGYFRGKPISWIYRVA